MKKRLSTLALSLTLLFGLCQPAQANIGSLDIVFGEVDR